MSIGVSEEKFMDSTPNELEPYVEAFRLKKKRKDCSQWQNGFYTIAAIASVIDKILSKNPTVNYPDKPLTESIEEKNEKELLTEDQKQKEINNFLMKLQLMQANFELNHPKNEDEQK